MLYSPTGGPPFSANVIDDWLLHSWAPQPTNSFVVVVVVVVVVSITDKYNNRYGTEFGPLKRAVL